MSVQSHSFALGMPLVALTLSASATELRRLQAIGEPVSQPVQVRALVDTGASHTCVDPTVLETLRLRASGAREMRTLTTGNVPLLVETFDIAIIFAQGTEDRLLFPNLSVSSREMLSTQGFEVLLGRDVLARCLLIYDGPAQRFTFAY